MSDSLDDPWVDFDDALARVFKEIEPVPKDGKGNRSRYPTLTAVYAAVRETLTAEGFSFPQFVTGSMIDGIWVVQVTTQLRRKGLMLESTEMIPCGPKPTAQEVGSANTYGRRYGLAAICGITPDEDDDGQRAQQASERQSPKNRQKKPPADPKAKVRERLTNAAKAYDDETKAQGLKPRRWADICSEAIGKEWSMDKSVPKSVEEYMAAARLFEKLTAELREGKAA